MQALFYEAWVWDTAQRLNFNPLWRCFPSILKVYLWEQHYTVYCNCDIECWADERQPWLWMLLQAHISPGHTFARGIHPSRSRVIQFHPPSPIMWRQFTVLGWKLQLSIFFVWLTSGMEAIKARHGPGACCRRQDYLECHIKSTSSALISEHDSIYPWILFMSVKKVSLEASLRDSFPEGSRRGWGFCFKLSLEKGVYYRNLTAGLES